MESYKWEGVIDILSEELEKVTYEKSDEKVSPKYRSLVERVKKNI